MFDRLTVESPAKINLGLKVFPKREDGYHNINSIFTTIGLTDTLEISVMEEDYNKNKCIVKCFDCINSSGNGLNSITNCKEFPLPEENTFTKAYKAFCVLTGIEYGVTIKVIKRIPSGGGLGGGSSNASSFIQSLDIIFGTHLDNCSLTSIAGQVGSDVFFFTQALISQGLIKNIESFVPYAAFVSGRGEIVQKIEARNDFSVLLVLPGVSVSTKIAYELVDKQLANSQLLLDNKDLFESKEIFDSKELENSDLINKKNENLLNFKTLNEKKCTKGAIIYGEDIYNQNVEKWSFVNDFTSPVCNVFTKVRDALNELKSSGADFADMSGSGSTVFGVFNSRQKALQAQKLLSEKWQTVLT